jgi:transposase
MCTTQEARGLVDQDELVIITERVDDVALLVGQMIQMGLQEIVDRFIPIHWKQRGLSWGWTTVVWLAYILSEGDHRKVSMQAYVQGMQHSLSRLTGQKIEPLDFSDDRLAHLLRYLSQREFWTKIEQALTQRSVAVYELPQAVVRCDATTVSGYHEVEEGGLIQYGHSKDDPHLAQIKVMTGSLDPLGMPLVVDVVSGEQGDDGLYIPVIERIEAGLNKSGLLFVGDCKMSAFEIRLHLVGSHHHYLSPLPLTGTTAEEMGDWITEAMIRDRTGRLELVFRNNAKGEAVLIGGGYEFERLQAGQFGEQRVQWSERVLVVKSIQHAEQQSRGLEKRLETAQRQIEALTPPRARGRRQITEEAVLLEAIDKILENQRVKGLLEVAYEKQVQQQTQYVGRGRGSDQRAQRLIERVRYQITAVVRNETAIDKAKEGFGWKAFVTSVSKAQLSLAEAVGCYRKEYRVERIFNRLKSRLNIAPLFVRREDQITGMTHLLSLGVRVLSLVEFVVRRSLQQDQSTLAELHPENCQKTTDQPTAERLLKAFSKISLTIIKKSNAELVRHITPLSAVQKQILHSLGLECSLYHQLEIPDSGI